MWTDFSIVAATKNRMRLENSINRMKDRERAKLHKLETLQQKKFIAQFYLDKHRVEASPFDIQRFAPEQLEVVLRKRTIKKREHDAAVCIQKHARRLVQTKRYRELVARRDRASRRIQRAWKRFKQLCLIPRALAARKNKAALLIQRYARGYVEWRGVNRVIREKRMRQTLEYFGSLRDKVVEDCQIFIRYQWKRYKVRKKKRIEEEKRRKREEAKKGKGRRSYGMTKKSSISVKKPAPKPAAKNPSAATSGAASERSCGHGSRIADEKSEKSSIASASGTDGFRNTIGQSTMQDF